MSYFQYLMLVVVGIGAALLGWSIGQAITAAALLAWRAFA